MAVHERRGYKGDSYLRFKGVVRFATAREALKRQCKGVVGVGDLLWVAGRVMAGQVFVRAGRG